MELGDERQRVGTADARGGRHTEATAGAEPDCSAAEANAGAATARAGRGRLQQPVFGHPQHLGAKHYSSK